MYSQFHVNEDRFKCKMKRETEDMSFKLNMLHITASLLSYRYSKVIANIRLVRSFSIRGLILGDV